jgi:hypothetical protein
MAIIDLNFEAHTIKMTMTKFGLVKICSAVPRRRFLKKILQTDDRCKVMAIIIVLTGLVDNTGHKW